MSREQNKEYTDWLKQSIKEFVDGIDFKADLEMLYGMARAGFLDGKAEKGGAVMNREEYKSEIIRTITETDNIRFIESIYSFIKGMLAVRKGGAA